jgi:hypothetical protein
MRRLYWPSIFLILFFACEEKIEQDLTDLNYEVSTIQLKQGKEFISESPNITGAGPFEFEIESIANDNGNTFTGIIGINIDSENGIISIADGNQIEIGTYDLAVKVNNGNVSKVFEEAFEISILPLNQPENLNYIENELRLNYDEEFVSELPEIDGAAPFTFKLINNDYDFVSIDSTNGIISISDAEKLSDLYALDIMVTNEDGETTFENTFTFTVLGQFAGTTDGYYLYEKQNDHLSAILDQNIVEWEGFTGAAREGLHYTYTYLAAGEYHLIKVGSEGDLLEQFGGSTVNETISESYCGYDSYFAINELEENGVDFNIENSGLYLVSYDENLAEVFYHHIQKAGFIGDATEDGWMQEQNLAPSITSSEVYFQNSSMQLREGELKIRFNCNWNIDRRINPSESQTNSDNGYIVATNLGGELDNLTVGSLNGNISIENWQEGVYDVKLLLNTENRFELELIRLGDLPEIDFNPDENRWAITGAATTVGWPADNNCGLEGQDIDFTYIGENNETHRWQLDNIEISAGQFIFRANDCWNKIINIENGSLSGPASENFSPTNNNFECNTASNYSMILSTNDNGDSYMIEISEN